MKSYLFPGQGAQFLGMGKDMYDQYDHIARMFEEANKLLGFEITDILFGDDEDALKRTDVTQPAIYIHSMAKALILGDDFRPDMAAGHSLGEFSALAACGAMTFEDGLRLVSMRAKAMQEACEANPGTMAAVLGLDDQIVEEVCGNIDEVVVPANYNCPGQLVISGSLDGIKIASEKLAKLHPRLSTLFESSVTRLMPIDVILDTFAGTAAILFYISIYSFSRSKKTIKK